jgi:hypothetical protein
MAEKCGIYIMGVQLCKWYPGENANNKKCIIIHHNGKVQCTDDTSFAASLLTEFYSLVV